MQRRRKWRRQHLAALQRGFLNNQPTAKDTVYQRVLQMSGTLIYYEGVKKLLKHAKLQP